MGSRINATCTTCDFETVFSYGGTRLSYKTHSYVPALNTETGELESVNYITEKKYPKYNFYTDSELKGVNTGFKTFDNFDLKLSAKNNFCPKCKNFSLDFTQGMFID